MVASELPAGRLSRLAEPAERRRGTGRSRLAGSIYVPIEQAVWDYVATVLPSKPDEVAILGVDTEAIPIRTKG